MLLYFILKGGADMKKIISVILCAAVVFGCVFTFSYAEEGKTYYIDSISGSDENDGLSENNAFAGVEPLRELSLEAGDKVLFRRDGIYNCTCLVLSCSGTEDSPIEISAYGDGTKPILTTNERADVIRLFDCSYITVSDLEITAANGGGIWIDTREAESRGITLTGLTMHDIQNTKAHSRDNLLSPTEARACVMVKSLPAKSRYAVNDLTISDCEMYDCGNGISIWGSWNDKQNPWCKTADEVNPVFNENLLVKNCYFHDMDAEAAVIGICDGAIITDCRCINCCQNSGINEDGSSFCNAAMWFWGSINSTFRYCEIAGQKTVTDGMACDFDSFTHRCTYEYIYSHDNVRFVNNCPILTGQHDNCIRYCLSVNDNVERNSLGQAGKINREYGLKFYNNTIINPSEFAIEGVVDGLIANNIFVGDMTSSFRWSRKYIDDDTGESYYNDFSGRMTNNCFWGTCIPSCSEDSIVSNPGFAGKDAANPDSFRLADSSKLLGKGINIGKSYGKDIFGNEITDTVNVGCYAGTGEADAEKPDLFDSIYRIINTVLAKIYQFIVDCNNRYWLF